VIASGENDRARIGCEELHSHLVLLAPLKRLPTRLMNLSVLAIVLRQWLSSAPDPFVTSPYEPLRSTMQAPPTRRMSAQRLLALSNISVLTRIW